jgi:indolepyruvate ferredoxin oxidoreductase alpha subunit
LSCVFRQNKRERLLLGKSLLMGNEAIALGALRAGVQVVTGYPGTPSTEILETIAKRIRGDDRTAGEVYVEWSVNEKAALETAAGAALAGARSMVTMKQVGLNVASDPLMSLAYIGVRGGMVVVTADDPGPISSQTEQDTRRFGAYAKVAVFDPSSPEEAYFMIAEAFDWSEKYGRPVIFRPTTRICHSYSSVELLPDLPRKIPGGFDRSGGRRVIYPSLANKNHRLIEGELVRMAEEFSSFPANRITVPGGEDSSGEIVPRGIASGGVSLAYTEEALSLLENPGGLKLFKIGTYPLPEKKALEFLRGLEEVLVIEELDPVIEDELTRLCGRERLPLRIRGKRSGDISQAGENTVPAVADALRRFLGLPPAENGGAPEGRRGDSEPDPQEGLELPGPPPLPHRPPVLCAGCPHRGSLLAVKEAVRLYNATRGERKRRAVYSGDIGCYTLGNAPPLDMVDTCLCMGAGITMAQGIHRAEALGGADTLNFAFIGDSTFFHTGIPGIVNGIYNRSSVIVVILDNHTTAMTGNQPHPGTGKTIRGEAVEGLSIRRILEALGVTDIAEADPFDLPSSIGIVTQSLDKTGVRALIFEGPCAALKPGGLPGGSCFIAPQGCTGCLICVKKLGCPAISLGEAEKEETPKTGGTAGEKPRPAGRRAKALIDPALCTGCGLCKGVCPSGAIQ